MTRSSARRKVSPLGSTKPNAGLEPDGGKGRGFYDRKFADDELIDLATLLTTGLDSEISMLRVVLRRFFEQAQGSQSVTELAEMLQNIGLGATRLASLLKSQQALGDDRGDELAKAIYAAIDQVSKEMHLSP